MLHVVPALFDAEDGIVGGAERYAWELARHMAERVPTRLVTFGARPRELADGPLRIKVLGPARFVRGERTNPIPGGLFRELRGADVVHCHQRRVLASSFAAAACRLSGRRVFVTDLGGGGLDISAWMDTTRWFHGHLHISRFSREVYGHAALPRTHVIYGGVDGERFSPPPAATERTKVVFVGRLLPHKGIDALIAALPLDLRLEVIGRVHDPAFVERLRQLATGKRVVFRHDCDDPALVAAYRSAVCVVLPSVYRTAEGAESPVPELLGQTLLEGMACGAPALCTSVASLPEVVEDGVTGFVVAPGDVRALGERLRRLADDPRLTRSLGENARRHVLERFSWRAVVDRCLEIYRTGHAPGEQERTGG